MKPQDIIRSKLVQDVAIRASWALSHILTEDRQDLTELKDDAAKDADPDDYTEQIHDRTNDIEQNQLPYEVIRAALRKFGF